MTIVVCSLPLTTYNTGVLFTLAYIIEVYIIEQCIIVSRDLNIKEKILSRHFYEISAQENHKTSTEPR